MRRKMGNVANGRQKSFVYTCALIGLTIYGVPQLPKLQHGLAGTFTALWLLFVALSVGANLYFLFGTDKERKRILDEQTAKTKTEAADSAHRRVRA